MTEQVTVVIPAYNEGSRIAAVLKPLIRARKHGLIKDIIVVDDGSADDTARVISNFNVNYIKIEVNSGKGAALSSGIKAVTTELILFLDADLVGLRESHIQKLVTPMTDNRKLGMTIGIFRKSGFVANIGNMLTILSGQRVVRKRWVEQVPLLDESRYGADYLMTSYAFKNNIKTMKIYLDRLSHVRKEQKTMFFIGFFHHRMKMYAEIMRTVFTSVK